MAMLWPYLATIGLLAALAWFAWRRRSVPGALPLAIGCLFASLWAGGSAAALAAADPAAKLAWYKFLVVWAIPAATAGTCFALDYVQPGRWLTRRNVMLFAIPSFVALLLILTNDLHHWLLRGFEVGVSVVPLPGPAWWPMVGFTLSLYLVSLAAFAWLFARSPQHRGPVALMIAGGIAGRLAAIVGLGGEPIARQLDLPLPTLLIQSCCYAIALFGFRILDPLPAAVRTAIEQMRDGMVVFGPGWQVLGLNSAAEQMLGMPASRARAKTWPELLPGCPDLRARLASAGSGPRQGSRVSAEATLATDSGARYYALDLSALLDFRGPVMGYLLLLHDVTEERHAREAQKQQQLLVATTQERERLARELHDSLGQVLAAARLQAGSARLLLARGEIAQTDECLERLASMTTDAEADVREYLLGARTGFAPGLSFFALLREYMQRFGRQYDLEVELAVPAQLEARGLEPAVEVQLLRIVQEALSNVRKHARAQSAQVSFSASDAAVQVAIADDGHGFDPSSAAAAQADGFGLQSMRERAEALGGRLEVTSQPSSGTRVLVTVPVGW
jgi:PAS domain S-box-containing protein